MTAGNDSMIVDWTESGFETSLPWEVIRDVLEEHERQLEIWNVQNHDPIIYSAILVEEVGELMKSALHTKFGGEKASELRVEAVHSAAVALAVIACLDRGEWVWGGPDE